MRKVLLSGVAAVAFSTAAAHAAPLLQYQVLDGATVISTGTTTSTTGILALSASDSTFAVSGNAVSAPFLNTPNFSTNTFDISSGGAGTLTIRISATGLTGYSGGAIANTFTLNSLNGGSFTTGTISSYFDNSNTAFGTGTLLATQTFNGSNSFSYSNVASTAPSTPFSETTVYTLSYGAGSVGTVSASSQLNAVPEPASLALLSAGLIGVGMIRRRRQA